MRDISSLIRSKGSSIAAPVKTPETAKTPRQSSVLTAMMTANNSNTNNNSNNSSTNNNSFDQCFVRWFTTSRKSMLDVGTRLEDAASSPRCQFVWSLSTFFPQCFLSVSSYSFSSFSVSNLLPSSVSSSSSASSSSSSSSSSFNFFFSFFFFFSF